MPTDSPILCFAITRAVHFWACLTILGVWMFDRIVMAAAHESMIDSIPIGWRRGARRLMVAALPTAVISGAAWFAFVAIAMSGLPANEALKPAVLRLVWSQTYFGGVWKWRTIFLGLSAVTAVWVFVSPATERFPAKRVWPAIVIGVLLVASLAFSGHGQTGLSPRWHLVADLLHLLTASLWPIGLLPLGMVLWGILGSSDPLRWKCAAQLTQRFSTMSLAAVSLLGVSGIMNAWCLLGSFNALISTSYGRVLMLKIILFLIMLMLAAMNRLVLKPRLLAHTDQSPQTAARLQISTAIEFILSILILIITGLLGTLPPAQM